MKGDIFKGLIFCISVNIARGLGVDYLVTLQHGNVLSKCEKYPDNFIPLAFDISNVTFEYQEDDVVLAKGAVKYILDLPPTQEIKLQLDLFKKQRSEWVSTVYSIQRNSLCETVFSPSEVWYDYVKDLPEDKRSCPPEKGTVYDLDLSLETELKNSQDRNREGNYKVEAKLTFGEESNDFICFNVLFELNRI